LAALDVTLEDAALFQRLAAHVLFTGPALRSQESVTGNRLGQSGLWPHAVSGDLPIVLARFGGLNELDLAGQLLRAHAYWRRCGLVVDLVLLNDAEPSDDLHDRLAELVRLCPTSELADKPGGVFLRAAGRIPADDVMLFEAAACAILRGNDGLLAAQLSGRPPGDAAGRPASHSHDRDDHCRQAALPRRLLFANGWAASRLTDGTSRALRAAAAGAVEQRPRQRAGC
jgi:cellobiose phosphorylase